MLNAVLFDLDNTLIDRNQAFRRCVEAEFSDPTVCADLIERDAGGHGHREALLSYWERHAGAPITLGRLGELIADRLRPNPSLLATLRNLSASVKLGVITNGGGRVQRLKLRAAGVDEVIASERVWISEEVGHAKPDARIFHLATQVLGVDPGNCLFIGDHAIHDLAGATVAGMRAHLVKTVLSGALLSALVQEEQSR